MTRALAIILRLDKTSAAQFTGEFKIRRIYESHSNEVLLLSRKYLRDYFDRRATAARDRRFLARVTKFRNK